MRWERQYGEDRDSRGWLEVETPVGQFVVEEGSRGLHASWWPNHAPYADLPVTIGYYRTLGAAKSACKRFCKRMATSFKAMAKAGWQ